MVSPFYIGNNPADDVGGRYPGAPMSGGANRFKAPPAFFDIDSEFDALWNDAVKKIEKYTTDLPNTFWEEQKKAWKNTFVIASGGGEYRTTDPYALEFTGESNQFIKPEFQIDLIKSIRDPKGQLSDIAKALSVENLAGDLRKDGSDKLYNSMIFGNGTSGMGLLSQSLMQASLDSFQERYNARYPSSTTTTIPLNIFAPDPNRTVSAVFREKKVSTLEDIAQAALSGGTAQKSGTTYEDARASFGNAFIKFTRVQDSQKNTSGFKAFVNETGKAMKDLFNEDTTGPGGIPANMIQSAAGALGSGSAQDIAKLTDSFTRFSSMQTVHDGVMSLFGPVGGATLSSTLIGALEATRVTPAIPGVPIDFGTAASDKQYEAVATSLGSFATSLNTLDQNIDKLINSYTASTTLSTAQKNRVIDWGNSMKREIRSVAGVDTTYNLANLSTDWKNLYTINSTADRLNPQKVAQRRALASRIKNFNSRVNERDITSLGLSMKLSQIFMDDHILPFPTRDGLLSASSITGTTQFGRQIQMYALNVSDSFGSNYANNLYNIVSSGKLDSLIFKSRVLSLIPYYAPQKIVSRFLISNHYFGLSIDEKTYEKDNADLPFFSRFGNGLVKRVVKSKTFGFILQNRFDIKLDIGGNAINVARGVRGGSAFNVVAELNRFAKMDAVIFDQQFLQSAPALLQAITSLRQIHPTLTNKDAFLFLLLHTEDDATFKSLFKDTPFADAAKLEANLKAFRSWIKSLCTSGTQLDIFDASGNCLLDPSKFANMQELLKWFEKRSLNPTYFIDVTSEAAGVVQKLSQKLYVVFDKIFSYKVFGVEIGKIFTLEAAATKLLANKLRTLLAKIAVKLGLRAALGAATGGVALVVIPLVEKALYIVSQKTIGSAKKALKALVTLDFNTFGSVFEQSIIKTMKTLSYVWLVMFLIVFIPYNILNSVMLNLTPKAPYPYNDITFGVPITLLPGTTPSPGACAGGALTQGGFVTWWQAYNGNESTGHGSNAYWDAVASFYGRCSFPQPSVGGGWGPTQALDTANGDTVTNYCRSIHPNNLSNSYGAAVDIGYPFPNSATGAGKAICAPAYRDVVEWVSGIPATTGAGARLILNGFVLDGSGRKVPRYRLLLLHLDPSTVVAGDTVLLPGDGVGTVWNWAGSPANSHVHIELSDSNSNALDPLDGISL